MKFSLPSLFACAISLTVLTLILFILLSKNRLLSHTGIHTVYLFSIFIIIRGFLPFDFSTVRLIKTFSSARIVPFFHKFMGSSVSLPSLLLTLWIGLGGLILLLKAIGYMGYSRKVSRLPLCTSHELTALCRLAAKTVKLHRGSVCRIAAADGIPAPAVFGIVHPVILLPNIPYTKNELYCIFVHELLHVKNRDFIVKILCDMLAAIYWWNPVIACMLPSALRQVQELHVDLCALQVLKKRTIPSYLGSIHKTVLNLYASQKEKQHRVYSLCDGSSRKKILQRLAFIVHPGRRTPFVPLVICSAALFLSFMFTFEAVYIPRTGETGGQEFKMIEGIPYFTRHSDSYDLYLDTRHIYTAPAAIWDFREFHI